MLPLRMAILRRSVITGTLLRQRQRSPGICCPGAPVDTCLPGSKSAAVSATGAAAAISCSPTATVFPASASSRNIRIRVRTLTIRTIRMWTRWQTTRLSLLLPCRSINSRRAPNRLHLGLLATGPTLRPATTGFPESGPRLPMLERYGLPGIGATTVTAMDGIVAIGDAISATTVV